MELENQELENQLSGHEEDLQKTELQFKQKVANYDALTRQLEVALEDGRRKVIFLKNAPYILMYLFSVP